ncbi:hypothetical protein [Azospirillum melinis]
MAYWVESAVFWRKIGMTARSYTFTVNDVDFEFSVTSGTVLGTDQRSDTKVWGGGGTVIVDGTGGGRTNINSQVDVVRDLWLRDDNGQEHHFRFNQDIPLREGHRVHCIFLSGRDLNENKKFSTVYSVFDSSVNKCWHLNGVAEAVKMPNYVSANDWFVGCALLLVYGVGVLVLGALIYLRLSGRKSTDGAKRAQLDLLSEIKGHHQKLIDDLYATQQKQEPNVAVAFS